MGYKKETAYHEAGHIVAAYCAGYRVFGALIRKNGSGCAYVDQPRPKAKGLSQREARDGLWINLSGVAAMMLLTREQPDWAKAGALPVARLPGKRIPPPFPHPGSDYAYALQCAARLGKPDWEAYLHRVVLWVRRQLWNQWPIVEAIAKELMQRGRLGPRRLRSIIASAEGIPPAGRMPRMKRPRRPEFTSSTADVRGRILPVRNGDSKVR